MFLAYTGYVKRILAIGGISVKDTMEQPKPSKKQFPKREELPYGHQPDQDGRSDYGRDGETTQDR